MYANSCTKGYEWSSVSTTQQQTRYINKQGKSTNKVHKPDPLQVEHHAVLSPKQTSMKEKALNRVGIWMTGGKSTETRHTHVGMMSPPPPTPNPPSGVHFHVTTVAHKCSSFSDLVTWSWTTMDTSNTELDHTLSIIRMSTQFLQKINTITCFHTF